MFLCFRNINLYCLLLMAQDVQCLKNKMINKPWFLVPNSSSSLVNYSNYFKGQTMTNLTSSARFVHLLFSAL